MSNDLMRGRQVAVPMTNKTAGAVAEGDVVILSSADASSFISTTTSAQSDDFVGVVVDAAIASNAVGRVCIMGYVPKINLASSAALGDYLYTHTVAKQGQKNSTKLAGAFGQAMSTGTTPAAFIWGAPIQTASSSGTPTATRIAVTLYDNTLGSPGEWDVSSLSQDYDDLELWIEASSAASVANDTVYVMLNNDTTEANYTYVRLGATPSGTYTSAAALPAVTLSAPGATATGGPDHASIKIRIMDYKQATYHHQMDVETVYRFNSSLAIERTAVSWNVTPAAIDRIQVRVDGYSSDHFATGSRLRIIGYRELSMLAS